MQMTCSYSPALLSILATSCVEDNSAVTNGVWPEKSIIVMSALYAKSTRTQSIYPLDAAKCNGVHPLKEQIFGSPPFCNNNFSTFGWL